ncbi:MAG: MoaD/ThiS family protein [Desulfobacteraceae bacterium]|jgi:sulfur carrier protein ThiS|nr:MoaD/ThiS family protein [Desulfobacteraceae bacterium]
MRVRAKGYNEAARYTAALPPDGALELPAESTVDDLLQALNFPNQFVGDLVILVDGRPASLETPLREGHQVVFFGALAGG